MHFLVYSIIFQTFLFAEVLAFRLRPSVNQKTKIRLFSGIDVSGLPTDYELTLQQIALNNVDSSSNFGSVSDIQNGLIVIAGLGLRYQFSFPTPN